MLKDIFLGACLLALSIVAGATVADVVIDARHRINGSPTTKQLQNARIKDLERVVASQDKTVEALEAQLRMERAEGRKKDQIIKELRGATDGT